MNENKYPVTNIGVISLMMIFIVLTMIIFSTLTLTTAINHSTQTSEYADHITDYYKANNKAEEKISLIEDALRNDDYYNVLKEEGIEIKNDTYSFIETINDKQSLCVTVKITYPSYSITQWQTVYTSEWEADNSVTLLPIEK